MSGRRRCPGALGWRLRKRKEPQKRTRESEEPHDKKANHKHGIAQVAVSFRSVYTLLGTTSNAAYHSTIHITFRSKPAHKIQPILHTKITQPNFNRLQKCHMQNAHPKKLLQCQISCVPIPKNAITHGIHAPNNANHASKGTYKRRAYTNARLLHRP